MDVPRIIVGTVDGLHQPATTEPVTLAGRSVSHVVGTSGDLSALTDDGIVWNRNQTGEWHQLARGGPDRPDCLLVDGDRLLLGGAGASLLQISDATPQRVASFDEAPGRTDWYTPWGGPPDVRSMARGVDETLYVNVHVGCVVRSTDGGTTWTDTMDIDADVHQVAAHPRNPGHAYVACAWGFGITTDGADTWEFTAEGMTHSYCRAVAVSATSIFVSSSQGAGGGRAALYRRPIDGGVFERCTDGLPDWFSANLNTFCLDATGQWVVAGDANGTVYQSADDGDTWTVAAADLPGVRCLTMV